MRCGRWISGVAAVVITGAVAAGCANEQPRELRGGERASSGQQQRGQQGARAGEGQRIDQTSRSHELDGRSFIVELRGPEGKQISDELIFRDGTFDSVACHQYGFSAAPYTALEGPEGGLTFRSVTSSTEGTMRWNGTVKGDQIQGTAVVNESGKEPVYYSYSGSLQTPSSGRTQGK